MGVKSMEKENDMKKNIYFNHDGGVDDLISLFLLLKMENVKLNQLIVCQYFSIKNLNLS